MKNKRHLFMAIGLVLLFVSPVISCSTPSPIPEPPKVEDGWIRLRIEDVGSIDYPTDFLELQSEEYRDIEKETSQVLGLGKSYFTLQQVGLNELLPSAFKEYRRVILQTFYLNPGEEGFRANEKYTVSRQELAELQNEWTNQLRQEYAKLKSKGLGDHKIIDSGSLEIVEVNGMFPLVWTWSEPLNLDTPG